MKEHVAIYIKEVYVNCDIFVLKMDGMWKGDSLDIVTSFSTAAYSLAF